jgi:glycosyltransferase involved in cell wall biosynthesis
MSEREKRVLIVSFYFPPMNAIGAVRISKFAKYLPQFGWQPLILTADDKKVKTSELSIEIKEANVFRTPYFTIDTYFQQKLVSSNGTADGAQTSNKQSFARKSAARVLRSAYPLYSLPLIRILFSDPVGWYRTAIQKGIKIIDEYKPDIIFSSYGPTLSHLVASSLNRKTKIPWIAEYRDPWSQNQYNSKLQPFQFLEEKLERDTLKGSGSMVAVSDLLACKLKDFHGKEVAVITNGFDNEDYAGDFPLSPKFTITHTGNIYKGRRDPTQLFNAIKQLKDEGVISEDNFEVRFYGSFISSIYPVIEQLDLRNLVKTYDLVSYQESIKKQKESSALLLLTWDNAGEWTYPGKLFEYMGAGRPILATAYKGGPIDTLLNKSGCGVIANEAEEIKLVLKKWMIEFSQSKKISFGYRPDSKIIDHYSRKDQARQLAEVFDRTRNPVIR